MSHAVLLGDSIFDNAEYVPDGPALIDQLRAALPDDWRATLLAIDGSMAADVVEQLDELPVDASHLIISAGGNDALEFAAVLRSSPGGSPQDVLARLGEIRRQFAASYASMIDRVRSTQLSTTVCTIYDAIPGLSAGDRAGLCLFNDVILRVAIERGLPVIDLRMVCNEASDYSAISPIEPSAAGGRKIALALVRFLTIPGRRASIHA